MATTLNAMRRDCRLTTRVIAAELFPAAIELGHRLPPPLFRARMVCIPVLISVMRDQIDREMRCLAVMRGPSINAIAASLDLPFETVRRNVQRMAESGWIEIGDSGGLSLPTSMPAVLAGWCHELAGTLRRAAAMVEALDGIEPGALSELACDHSAALAGLDLMLAMANTSTLFGLRYAELLLVHYVCNASVAHLNDRPEGSAPFPRIDTVPDSSERSFVPLAQLSQTLGLSRSTVYRIISQATQDRIFERRGNGVRATEEFLKSPIYVGALEAIAGRTAMLLSRTRRHRCGMGCASLDQTLGEGRHRHPSSTAQLGMQPG